AFATGATKKRSMVAVSAGLLNEMDDDAVEGVIAHEVAHIANGDMVTMTLLQGVVNTFVVFLSRIVAFVASRFVREEVAPLVHLIAVIDRKSTRLNSSHVSISYAVFCLKKK